jgi:hypothetical protein
VGKLLGGRLDYVAFTEAVKELLKSLYKEELKLFYPWAVDRKALRRALARRARRRGLVDLPVAREGRARTKSEGVPTKHHGDT